MIKSMPTFSKKDLKLPAIVGKGRLAWTMGREAEAFTAKKDIRPLNKKEKNTVLFKTETVANLYAPSADERFDNKDKYKREEPEYFVIEPHKGRLKLLGKYPDDYGFFGHREFITFPAGTTLKEFTDGVNKFYNSKIKADDPLFKGSKAGQAQVGKTRLYLLADSRFYEGDLQYDALLYDGKPVVGFGLGS